LRQQLTAQDDFVADASHQLRTPLTALRLRLENLERDVQPDVKSELTGALAEVERLAGLVDALLALARVDRAGSSPEPIDLETLVADASTRGRRLQRSAASISRCDSTGISGCS
jgi:signal transduction histidine kinase